MNSWPCRSLNSIATRYFVGQVHAPLYTCARTPRVCVSVQIVAVCAGGSQWILLLFTWYEHLTAKQWMRIR